MSDTRQEVLEALAALRLTLEESDQDWLPVLLNNLSSFAEAVEHSQDAAEIERASGSLGRYSVDSLPWGSPLMNAVSALAEKGRRLSSAMRRR